MDEMALSQLYTTLETRFDQAARQYDQQYGPPSGSQPGNPLITWLREEHLALLRGVVAPGASLLDIGCGTGEEAVTLAREGYSVLGVDISPAMVRQAQTKAAAFGLRREAVFKTLAAGKLDQLDERGPFGGAYASLGTLNTEPALPALALALYARLEPGAPLVATVMSRHCWFEIWYNFWRFKPGETLDRGGEWAESRAGASGVTAPVKFYTPRGFAAPFAPHFTVESVTALPLFLPPLHLHELYRDNVPRFGRKLARERRLRSRPGWRAWGDHFVMVLRRAEVQENANPSP